MIHGNLQVASQSGLYASGGGTLEVLGDVTGSGQLVVDGGPDPNPSDKTYAVFRGDTSGFSGGLRIESGRFWIADTGGAGTGDIEVMAGGQLALGNFRYDDPAIQVDNRVDLFGGTLVSYGGGSNDPRMTVTVTGDIVVHEDGFLGAKNDRGLDIAGRLILTDGADLFALGEYGSRDSEKMVELSGQLLVGADTSWNMFQSSLLITGEIRASATEASLDVLGRTDLLYGTGSTSLWVGEGQSLTVLRHGLKAEYWIDGEGNTVRGAGVLRNDITLSDGAAIEPGDELVGSVGQLEIDGQVSLQWGGTLAIEIGGLARGAQYDTLHLTGQVALDGVLNASLLDGFQPQAGDQFDILSATSGVTGRFAEQTMPQLEAGLGWSLRYDPNAIALQVIRPGDVNLDGVANGLDVDPFVAVLLDGSFQGEADMNLDGVVNGLDVDPFVAAVIGGTQAVPEPSTLWLAVVGIVAVLVIGGYRQRSFNRDPERGCRESTLPP